MDEMIRNIDSKIVDFTESVPAKGMHLEYLMKAEELATLYGELSFIMEVESPNSEQKIREIEQKVRKIVELN